MRQANTILRTIAAMLLFLVYPVIAGNEAGHGGDYADEFIEFRDYVVRIHESERKKYQELFKYTDKQFDAAQKRLKKVILRRKDKPGFLTVEDKEVPIIDLLPKPIDELFVIEGAPKTAINIEVAGHDLVLIDIEEWDKLDDKVRHSVPRKLQLMGHELYGILDLEKTGERHLSRQLNLNAMRATPFLSKDGIPVVPLWSAPFKATIRIKMNEDCWSPSAQKRLKKLIGQRCRPQLPDETPAPFFAYECAFEGKLITPVKKDYKITHYNVKAWVPGTHGHYDRHGSSYYFYQSSHHLIKLWQRYYTHGHWYRPGFYLNKSKTTYTPVYNKFCRIKGDIFLTGIDPIMTEQEPELLASSKDTWEEDMIFPMVDNPEQYVIDQCFAYRKTIRKGLFPKSRCIIRQLPGTWRWELWGIHPFRTPYQFDDVIQKQRGSENE